MKIINRIVAGLVALGMSPLALAGIVVIANPGVKTEALTQEQVVQFYMGRAAALADGTRVAPVDQPEGTSLREAFLGQALGKTEQQYRGFWTRQVFTGKGQPPRIVGNDAEVVRLVGSGTGFIGYVDSKSVTPKVKVLFRLD